jgi:uncharacterized membrane protein
MLLIGLLIMVAAAVFAGVLLSENWGGTTYQVDGFGHVLGHLTLAEIFIAGLSLMVIFFLGVWSMSVSSRMRKRASGRRRAETRAAREERDALLVERDRLAKELVAARAAQPLALDGSSRPIQLDERPTMAGQPQVVERSSV